MTENAPSNTEGGTKETALTTDKPNPTVTDSGADKTTEKVDDKTNVEYKDFKLAEGMNADAETLANFKELAKGLKLSQEDAQKLVDLQAKMATQQTKQIQDKWVEVRQSWKDAAKSDKEFGGEKFDANLAVAKKALAKFGTPELNDAIETYGMGDHPEIIRLLYKVGLTLTEDKIMEKGGTTSAPRDLAKTLFPNLA